MLPQLFEDHILIKVSKPVKHFYAYSNIDIKLV